MRSGSVGNTKRKGLLRESENAKSISLSLDQSGELP